MSIAGQGNLDETIAHVSPDGDLDQPKKTWFSGCLLGCLIVGAISVVVCAIGGYFAYTQGPQITITAGRGFIESVLQESSLPPDEQEAIVQQYDRLGDGYLNGQVNLEDIALVFNDLVESPAFTLLFVEVIDAVYVERSGLDAEEKEVARETLQRIFNGVMNDQLDNSELDELLEAIRKNPNSQDPTQKQQIKDKLTDEELRAFIQKAKELCDAKEIPAEESGTRISDKLKAIIDDRLSGDPSSM